MRLAEKYLSMEKDLIMVDEKKFQVNSSSQTVYVTRLPEQAYDEVMIDFCNTSSISSSADVNMFLYIGPFGKGKKKIKKGVNYLLIS